MVRQQSIKVRMCRCVNLRCLTTVYHDVRLTHTVIAMKRWLLQVHVVEDDFIQTGCCLYSLWNMPSTRLYQLSLDRVGTRAACRALPARIACSHQISLDITACDRQISFDITIVYIYIYTVDRKKRGSTFDITTLEKHARFLYFFQSYDVKCTATFFFGTQCIYLKLKSTEMSDFRPPRGSKIPKPITYTCDTGSKRRSIMNKRSK